MRKLLLVGLVLLAGCSGDQCWPTELTPDCPATHPYRNRWHPELCYAEPQTETPPFTGE